MALFPEHSFLLDVETRASIYDGVGEVVLEGPHVSIGYDIEDDIDDEFDDGDKAKNSTALTFLKEDAKLKMPLFVSSNRLQVRNPFLSVMKD